MTDYWLSESSRAAKQRLTVTVFVEAPDGETVLFGPQDRVIPDWAKDQIGRHAWGLGAPPVKPGPRLRFKGAASLAAPTHRGYIDIFCTGGGRSQTHSRVTLARFEVSEYLGDAPEMPIWDWWWTDTLNGPAGAFAHRSHVSWDAGKRQDWESTGPSAGSIGRMRPDDDQPMKISCTPSHTKENARVASCVASMNFRWHRYRDAFNRLQHAGLHDVALLDLRRTI